MAELNPHILRLGTIEELQAEMEKIGAEAEGIEIMAPKGLFRAVKLEGVEAALAKVLKEGMLALGGAAVLSQAAYRDEEVTTLGLSSRLGRVAEGVSKPRRIETDLLLLGTLSHYQRLTTKLRDGSSPGLIAIADGLEQALANYEGQSLQPLTIGPTPFEWGKRTYIMGIVNVTPDSFSGDGLAGDVEAAVAQAKGFVEEGVDIVDVGGESTRPGAEPIPVEEELRRVLPVVEGIARETEVVISIDTYKAEVARCALDAGAHMVNDVWGLRLDPDLGPLVVERGVPVVIMHNRSTPKAAAWVARLGGRYEGVKYQDLMADVARELRQGIERALEAGVAREKIIIDPGIGFGKTTEQNLTLLNRLAELKVLGRPILVGPSRKSFIGYTLDLPLDQRLEGTAATVALAIAHGADIVRVHDVREMVRVACMTDAMVRG